MVDEDGAAKSKDYKDYNVGLNKDSVLVGNKYKTVPMSNISFLRPGDIRRLIIGLCSEKEYVLNKDYFINKYNYENYEKMVYLKIIKNNNSNIVINPLIYELTNKIHSDIKNENIKHINDYYGNKIFYSRYGNYIRQLFLENRDISALVRLVKKSNLSNRYSIQEILEYCIKFNYEELFIRLFIGDRPTSGIEPLKNFSDICFNCSNLDNCIGQDLKKVSEEYILKLLLEYRNEYSKKCLENIIKTKDLTILLKNIIPLKFLASYNTVVNVKLLLIYLKILEKDHILYKNNGSYCPRKDIWRVRHDLLV